MAWFEGSEYGLNYTVEGRGANTLVLCHELGGSLESWDRVTDLLAGEYRILRYDQRGAGRSEKPVRAYAMERHADDLAALIDHLGLRPPFTLASAAAGAAIALLFARRRPADVAGAVLCSPATGVDPGRRHYLLERSATAAATGIRGIVDTTLGQSYPAEIRADEGAFLAYRGQFLGNDPIAYGFANAALANFDPEGLLEAIAFPVALVAGTHDRLRPPAFVESLARKIPTATYREIDSGHLMPVQAPEAVAQAIRDLQRRCG